MAIFLVYIWGIIVDLFGICKHAHGDSDGIADTYYELDADNTRTGEISTTQQADIDADGEAELEREHVIPSMSLVAAAAVSGSMYIASSSSFAAAVAATPSVRIAGVTVPARFWE